MTYAIIDFRCVTCNNCELHVAGDYTYVRSEAERFGRLHKKHDVVSIISDLHTRGISNSTKWWIAQGFTDEQAGYDDDLQAVLRFLRREGEFRHLGGALTTYPNRGDKRTLYMLCEELEQRGLAVRRTLTPDVVLFGAPEYTPEQLEKVRSLFPDEEVVIANESPALDYQPTPEQLASIGAHFPEGVRAAVEWTEGSDEIP